MKHLSQEVIAKKSIELAIMDALQNGLPTNKVAEYIKTDVFLNAAKGYQILFQEQF